MDDLGLDAQDALFFGEAELRNDLKAGIITPQQFTARLDLLRDRANEEYHAGEFGS